MYYFPHCITVSTSTLAMGVNLPAHLVVVKSTQHYAGGMYREYSETQILQMIGRAGRPQFDTTATAVIMTKHKTKVVLNQELFPFKIIIMITANIKQVMKHCVHKQMYTYRQTPTTSTIDKKTFYNLRYVNEIFSL